jgi:hypothetical protein
MHQWLSLRLIEPTPIHLSILRLVGQIGKKFMEIQYLKFDDHKEHWHLAETHLDSFNLLVGISGVGKTLITEAIKLICQVAIENNYQLDGIEWKIRFIHKEQAYEWMLKSALIKKDSPNNLLRFLKDEGSAQIVYEKIFNATTQEIIAERSDNFFSFKQENINPSINKQESIFTLFSGNVTISSIQKAFQSVIFSERETAHSRLGFSSPVDFNTITFEGFKQTLAQARRLD